MVQTRSGKKGSGKSNSANMEETQQSRGHGPVKSVEINLGAILKGSAFESGIEEQQQQQQQPVSETQPAVTEVATEATDTKSQSVESAKPAVEPPKSKVATIRKHIEAKGANEMKKDEARPISAKPKSSTERENSVATSQTDGSKVVPEPIKVKSANTSASQVRKSPTLTRKTPSTPPAAPPSGIASRIKGGPSKIVGVMRSAEVAKQGREQAAKANGSVISPKEAKPASVGITPRPRATSQSKTTASSAGPTTAKAPRQSLAVKPSVATSATTASMARKDAAKDGDREDRAKPAERKPTVVQAPRVASSSTAASLARKTTRQSLAPPAEQPRAKSRTSLAPKPASEGLLARLTKPTASSVNKSHDKLEPGSPPRSRNASHSSSKLPPKKGRLSLSHREKPTTNGVNASADSSPDDEGVPGPAIDSKTGVIAAEAETANESEKENAQPNTVSSEGIEA